MPRYYPQAAVTLRVVFEDFGDDLNPFLRREYTIEAQARRVVVAINAYTEADTFELELDYKVFPFDPRAIRSCQVSIHMEDMEALEEFGTRRVIAPTKDNAVFMGFADEDEMSFDEQSRTVKLKGRDFTGLLIDAKWPGTILDLGKPADLVITHIVKLLKATQDIQTENRTGLLTLPVLTAFYPDFGVLSGKRSAKKNETYWDVIQDICNRAGIVAYIELDVLVLTKPRTLYDPKAAVQFVYGRNISDLQITRRMGKQKGFNVAVRSLIGKEVVLAEIPKDSTTLDQGGDYIRIPKQAAGGGVIDKGAEEAIAPVISFAVANVRDKSHLIAIGEKIFEELGRQQIEGNFKTQNMCAPANEGKEDFNLLKLRNGTPISIVVASDDLAGIQRQASDPERMEYLISRYWKPEVAAIFAKTLGKYTTPFYTKSVQFTLDGTSGLTVDVEFINFIETAGKGLGLGI